MLDSHFIDEYHNEAMENYQKFLKISNEGGIDKGKEYNLAFFKKISHPLVRSEGHCYQTDGEKIWSQVPFCGTLLIPIQQSNEKNFIDLNGFEIEDIPDLIKLEKTGKIQFYLAQFPKSYQEMDFLEPIFQEIRPQFFSTISLDYLAGPKTAKKLISEFEELAKVSFGRWLAKRTKEYGEGARFYGVQMGFVAIAYARLRYLQMDEVTEEASNLLVDNPEEAFELLMRYSLLIEPSFNSMGAHQNRSLSLLQSYGIKSFKTGKENSKFPVEIGSILMKKLTNLPSSYEACISIIDNYKRNDLYKLLLSLDTAIRDQNRYSIIEKSKEVEESLENVWKDTNRISSAISTVKKGIGITLGLIGDLGTNMLGAGHTGLLAGLGYSMAEHMTHFDKISEKIVKALNKDYMVNIYDFKQKYNQS